MIQQNHGVMLGVVNNSRPLDRDDRENRFENFVQIGVVNMAENGVQIGLVNYNPNAWMPWMPLFNFSGFSFPHSPIASATCEERK